MQEKAQVLLGRGDGRRLVSDQQVDAAGLLVHLDRAQFLGRHLYAERLLHERWTAHAYGRAASRDDQIRVTGDGGIAGKGPPGNHGHGRCPAGHHRQALDPVELTALTTPGRGTSKGMGSQPAAVREAQKWQALVVSHVDDALEFVVVDERLRAAEDGIVIGRDGDRLAVQLTEPVHQPVRGTRAIRIREHSVLYERTGVEHRRNAFARGQVAASAYLGHRFGSCPVQGRGPSGQHLVDERLIQVWRPSNRVFTTRTCAHVPEVRRARTSATSHPGRSNRRKMA